MQITKVNVKGFKSLADFEMELSPFTCLIGLNGCGKSTVLQFFDFLSRLVGGEVDEWFQERRWLNHEVEGYLGDRKHIVFSIFFSDGSAWEGTYAIWEQRCIRESIKTETAHILLENGTLNGHVDAEDVPGNSRDALYLKTDLLAYRGSIANLIRDDKLPASVLHLRDFFRGTCAFDAFSPHSLRRRERGTPKSIGKSGEFLSAYFASISADTRAQIVKDLVEIYPQLHDVITIEHPSGNKELATVERYMVENPLTLHEIMVRSDHVNDGFLRTIAMLVELRGPHNFLLFDEIENGINPESVDFLIKKLTTSPHQVLVTTHSPMILNYLDDDLARQSVVFLYKGPDGATRARRFFEIPSISEKLEVMGPGEAFVDTNLVALTEELNAAVAGA